MPAILPPEVYDEIIDHLWDDLGALKACALTCRAWVPSSRLHLFRTVRINNAADCARFHALIAAAPPIARCVRRLTLCTEHAGAMADGRAKVDQGWVDEEGAELVKQLPGISTLGLSRINWEALKPATQQAIMALSRDVGTLFLFEVQFGQSRDVLEFLSAFPVLAELYFHGVSWAHDSSPGEDALHGLQQKMQLSYLFLDPRSSPTLVTEWLLSHPSEQRLRTIQLCWRELDNVKAVGDLLQASGASLEELQVEFPEGVPEGAVLENQLSLAANTGLRCLHFGGLNVTHSRAFLSQRLFPWVTVMLGQLRSRELKEVTFELEIATPGDLHGLDWARIDADLSREEFGGLAVMFYVNCAGTLGVACEGHVKKLIRGNLAGFQSRGTLCVSCI